MIGTVLGSRYEITATLAEGPIFTYCAAKDRLTGRTVAIRLIRPEYLDQPEFIASILEYADQFSIDHSGIERFSEVGRDAGGPYLVSELPKGSLLSERIKRFAPFSVAVALLTATAIAEALEVLHRHGVVHGDIGPHNVVATHDGAAKLQCAGMWRTYATSRTAGLQVLSQMAPYLAPEISTGGQPSEQSDLYSLGIVLFQLLTGRRPFDGETPMATALRHTNTVAPSVRGLNPSVPQSVDQLIQRLLEKHPKDRIQSSEELLRLFRGLSDQLRFGRAFPEEPVAKAAAPTPLKAEDAKQVAPKMGAVRAKRPRKEKIERERDVPLWLLWIVGVLFLSMVCAIGFWLVQSFRKPKLLEVPNFANMSFREATSMAEKLKLKVRIMSKEPSNSIEIDRVIRSYPGARSRIVEGGVVRVVLSSGTAMVVVPKLLDMTVDQAKRALSALNLELEGTPLRQVNTDFPPGAILRQMPEPGTKIQRFGRIRVWIAAPPDAPPGSLPGESPDGPPAYMYKLSLRMTDAESRVKVRIEIQDAKDTRELFNEYRDPNDEIEVQDIGYGDEVVFRIFYDDELRKEVKRTPKDAN